MGKARWEGRVKVENKNEVKKELTSGMRICVVDSRKIGGQGVKVHRAAKLVEVYLGDKSKELVGAVKSMEQADAEKAAANWQVKVS